MRRCGGVLAMLVAGACAGGPGVATAVRAAERDPLRLGPTATFVSPVPYSTSCDLVATASELAELLDLLGAAGSRQRLPECDFAVDRLVVAWLRAPGVAPPIAHTIHSEEGVDVVELVPAVEGAVERTLLHAFVVPLRPRQLAVVARLPVDGRLVEKTLAVFPAH